MSLTSSVDAVLADIDQHAELLAAALGCSEDIARRESIEYVMGTLDGQPELAEQVCARYLALGALTAA